MQSRGVGIVTAEGAPKAIGPYSQAVTADGTIYAAAQIALDPKTNEMVGRTTAAQTDQVLKNLAAVLRAAGSNLGLVVKTTVYLVDIEDFPAMNEVYARHFGAQLVENLLGSAISLVQRLQVFGGRCENLLIRRLEILSRHSIEHLEDRPTDDADESCK